MKKYYMGVDIGTDSVGYAVIDERYNVIKYKGEPMWGSHLFDAANPCAERRGFRTARRRLDRRQQRVHLVDEIFAPEVNKVDSEYYVRKKESRLWREDKTNSKTSHIFFADENYTDKEYNIEYPTIHHLIVDLMNTKEKKDIRLVNIAIDWLVAHRGHFLYEISLENVDQIRKFDKIYDNFINYFNDREEIDAPWGDIDVDELGNILKKKLGVLKKTALLKDVLYGGKIPKDDYEYNKTALVKFMAGGKVKCKDLFIKSEVDEDLSISLDDDADIVLPQLGDQAELIAHIYAMHDWAMLTDILGEYEYISEAKIHTYEQHREDLKQLKEFVKDYLPEKYAEIFKEAGKDLNNYTAYSYNLTSVKGKEYPKGKCGKDDFYAFLKKTIAFDKIEYKSEEDKNYADKVLNRIEKGDFLPKQVSGENRVIPYQLYYVELDKILKNMSEFYPFLNEKDSEGYTPIEKIESIFLFKIPYYVGPLRTDNGRYGWMKRKAEMTGKIYPWNFDKMVDEDQSEQEFINRMTNTCTYLPGEDVLPKNSLIYTKYTVLNEINNIKINEQPISVKAKQGIYEELFCKYKKVTRKKIEEYLRINGYLQEEDIVTGIDITIKSSLKPLNDFRNLLANKSLTRDDVEKIVERSTYTEDKVRYKAWIKSEFPNLSEDDYKYVCRQKYADFGRLSKKFLAELQGINKETGEEGSILYFLWETNDNLMQILASDRYTFMDEVKRIQKEYYSEHKLTLAEQLEELGISNSVKRPVMRTLDVVKDVVSAMKCAPEKIFVEMARGVDENGKGRTVTRKEQILELYKNVEEDTQELQRQLEAMGDTANNKLQSEALFLYYIQLGKCMYSGQPIDLAQLKTSKYNVDHIYPQSYVKDDSILNNKVLVLSEINGAKNNIYPIDKDIRSKMAYFWAMLKKSKLITDEKYARLTRKTPFTDNEKMGFINRQLVETRQSMKAVTQLLNQFYPDSEVVYVKARLASEFRQEFLHPKCRLINDLHHAKDAYLNAVVGNVYYERFNKNWFSVQDKYSVKAKTIFTHDVINKRTNKEIWLSDKDLPNVKRIYEKNNIHLTRYSYCKKGGLFDQMPVKAAKGLIPLKEGLNTEKYGGYNKPSASFYLLAHYLKGGKPEITFVPIDLMEANRVMSDDAYACEYAKRFIETICTKKIENVEILLNKRPIKIKTLLSLDGYEVWINGKDSGGKRIIVSNAMSLKLSKEDESYIKKIEKYVEKRKVNSSIKHDEKNDGLSLERNMKLYEILCDKYCNTIFAEIPGCQGRVMEEGKDLFYSSTFEEQLELLLIIVSSLKTGRAGGFNITSIGGKKLSGAMLINSSISGINYNSIKLVDVSPAGLHRVESENLMELL